jgi:hypothetical protein
MLRTDIVGIPFAALDPLLSGAVITSEGTVDINAEVSRSSSAGKPVISGNVLLGDLETTVAFNRATYSLHAADINIENGIAKLEGATIFDTEGNPAELRAEANLSNLSAISYSASLTPDNIIALNTGIRDNSTFYGKVYASGTINLRGDKMGVNVDITATTNDNSSFFMPLNSSS